MGCCCGKGAEAASAEYDSLDTSVEGELTALNSCAGSLSPGAAAPLPDILAKPPTSDPLAAALKSTRLARQASGAKLQAAQTTALAGKV